MDSIIRDIRFGLKLLVRNPGFAVTILLTLGMCIGANVAMWAVIDTVVLNPLPFKQPDRLVRLYNSYPGLGRERSTNSAPDFFFRRANIAGLEEVAAYRESANTVGASGGAERVSSLLATPSFFPMLGVSPALGRTFLEEEMSSAAERTVLLTFGYWQDRFGGSAGAIGQTLQIDGQPTLIVGVLPPDFRMPLQPDVRIVLPLSFDPRQRTLETWHENAYEMLGRLAPGATVERVQGEIDGLNAALTDEWPGDRQFLVDAAFRTVVVSAQEDLVRDLRLPLQLLWGGAVFVLLIGCVNVASLMLARSQIRRRELAMRLALGAPRVRVARQLLTEALVMGLLGGALGVGVGAVALRLLTFAGIEDLPRGTELGLNLPILLYAVALSLVASVLFGAIPVVDLFRTKFQTRASETRSARLLLRSGLVAAQVGLTFVLLVGAGLLLRSFRAVLAVDPGFRAEGVFTAYVSLPAVRYPSFAARRGFVDELLRQVRSLPGVTAAGVTDRLPFGSIGGGRYTLIPEGYESTQEGSLLVSWRSIAGPGYFEAMGMKILEGREFEETDGPDQGSVIIIDEWLARHYWPHRNPLGQRMVEFHPGGGGEEHVYTVIGVVGGVKQENLAASESGQVGAYYVTYRQQPIHQIALVVQTGVAPESLTGSIRTVLTRLDAELPLFDVQPLEHRLTESLTARRRPLVLFLGFAGVALFLAVLGIYGVLAYLVAQRRREIGIRMALGSQPAHVLVLVLRHGFLLIGIGLSGGALAAFFLVRLLQSLLFAVQPLDPLVFIGTVVLLGLVALAACWVPARRATRIDPVTALQE